MLQKPEQGRALARELYWVTASNAFRRNLPHLRGITRLCAMTEGSLRILLRQLGLYQIVPAGYAAEEIFSSIVGLGYSH